ncbi:MULTISPECIES: nucleotide exchange factor GrpE [Halorhodospira]|uniref:nucleotide exchange factor GrpE n=1 Tax=Halorhodospira TaxID=85108 RepID=UPI001EE917D1|nr:MULTISPECIES: nucleotide exchange factor GrpE [Halorhodospira]MCG5528255.1 nucleotide exchange factor GrpE [Halorhodospira halophila]MCG5543912.1 nucleotide exchange factor GrpE [Halorhodospira sp. 9628]
MDSSEREALVDRFRDYLERSAEAPQPEQAAPAPDLHTLLTEMAALKNDVRLESRQYKTALDQLSEDCETLRQQNRQLQEHLERERRRADLAHDDAEHALLQELIDLRDRLAAGHRQVTSHRPGWLARLGGARRYLGRMAQGMEMNLRHLDEILARRGVQVQETVRKPFDPQTMHAVDTATEPETDHGVVLREVRQGFLRGDRVLRTAEVIVNKRDST